MFTLQGPGFLQEPVKVLNPELDFLQCSAGDVAKVQVTAMAVQGGLPPGPGFLQGPTGAFFLKQRDGGEGVGGSFLGRGNAPMN